MTGKSQIRRILISELYIRDWQQYGDYMTIANLVEGDSRGVGLMVTGNVIRVSGVPNHVTRFAEKLEAEGIEYTSE